MTYNTNTLQHTIPADIYDNTTVWMEQQVSTSTRVENEGCPNDSVIYSVVLPDGIVIAGGTATFKGVSMGTPLYVGNTAIYYHAGCKLGCYLCCVRLFKVNNRKVYECL